MATKKQRKEIKRNKIFINKYTKNLNKGSTQKQIAEYISNNKEREQKDIEIVNNYSNIRYKSRIQLVDIQLFKQLEPLFQNEEYIKAYDYVLNGLNKGVGADSKYIETYKDRFELLTNIYKYVKDGGIINKESLNDYYANYTLLHYLSSLASVGEDSSKLYDTYKNAKDDLLRMKYDIFKMSAPNNNLTFEKFRSRMYEMMRDKIKTLDYSSSQALELTLSPEYDMYTGFKIAIDALMPKITVNNYKDIEEAQKNIKDDYNNYKNLQNSLLIKGLDSNTENTVDEKPFDILSAKPKEIVDKFNIKNYYSKNDSKLFRNIQAELDNYSNPTEVFTKIVNDILDSRLLNGNNNLDMNDMKLVYARLLTKVDKIDVKPETKLLFGTSYSDMISDELKNTLSFKLDDNDELGGDYI